LIYEITRERLGIAHDGIFFVDDIGQNLKTARSLGWQTYLFRKEEEALATLDAVLAAAQAAAQRGPARGSTRP
jgi:FMN phosphatase YigB (HAD superfamily)